MCASPSFGFFFFWASTLRLFVLCCAYAPGCASFSSTSVTECAGDRGWHALARAERAVSSLNLCCDARPCADHNAVVKRSRADVLLPSTSLGCACEPCCSQAGAQQTTTTPPPTFLPMQPNTFTCVCAAMCKHVAFDACGCRRPKLTAQKLNFTQRAGHDPSGALRADSFEACGDTYATFCA
jgi:hypothetical protein